MEKSIRTFSAAYLQSCMFRKQPYEVLEYTTLNEKLNIQPDLYPDVNVYPSLCAYAIGAGGHEFTLTADSYPVIDFLQHKATDTALFDQRPFVLRQINNDLDASQRARYALRKTMVINGQTYIGYYLKRIPMNVNPTTLQLRTIANGVTVSTPFVPTTDNLNPTPTATSNTGTNVLSNDNVICTTVLPISFTADDIQEYIDACVILFGDERRAIISEIALCSAVDKVITVNPDTGVSFNFNETIAVQIANFTSTFKLASENNNGLQMDIDFGSNDPLYRIV